MDFWASILLVKEAVCCMLSGLGDAVVRGRWNRLSSGDSMLDRGCHQ